MAKKAYVTIIEMTYDLPQTPQELIDMGLCLENDPRLRPGFIMRTNNGNNKSENTDRPTVSSNCKRKKSSTKDR